MIELVLIGIGTGNPEHLTLQAARALNSVDFIFIPRKGHDKSDLADLRRSICKHVVTNPATRIVEFDMPRRDTTNPRYRDGVDDWHDAVARAWSEAMRSAMIDTQADLKQTVAFLVWGDPALYDSTLRIAARLGADTAVTVIPGITSMQALTAAHSIPLNEINEPFLVTTGRQLRENGWPADVNTLVVMLDGDCAFQTLSPEGVTIWWGAYLGMPHEVIHSGGLDDVGAKIIATRATERARHGWIMDTYILRRALS